MREAAYGAAVVVLSMVLGEATIGSPGWAQAAPESGGPDVPEVAALPCDNGLAFAYPACSTGTAATSWNCWQQSLTSSKSYSNGYRDVILEATLTWDADPAYTYRTFAFWDGKSGLNDKFTFRMAFGPFPGPWTWTTTCVAGCLAGETGLATTGSVNVQTYSGPEHALYSHGLLTQRSYTTGSPPVLTKEPISHYDRSLFFWQGDAAWAAPLQACRNQWRQYIDNRKAKRFTVVQLGLAPKWAGEPSTGNNRGPKNKLSSAPFEKVSTCTESGVVPNNCSRWNPAYWEELDGMIRYANQQGIVVLLAGLISPYDRYPQESDITIFSRNLAARIRGNFVVLSPSFDDKPLETAYGSRKVQDLMNTAAVAARGSNLIYPLLINHYATIGSAEVGGAHAQTWLNANGFQSGYNSNNLDLVTGRPRTLAQEMRGSPTTAYQNPRKPALNLEAIYDYGYCGNNTSAACSSATHFNEFRARQAGWLSAFSGSTGYTMGSAGIWEWGICGAAYADRPQWMKTYKSCGDEPGSDSNIPSVSSGWRSYASAMDKWLSQQTQILGDGLRLWPWWDFMTTQAEQNRIVGNPTANDKRMVLARAAGLLVVYMPENASVTLNLAGTNVHPTLNRSMYNPRQPQVAWPVPTYSQNPEGTYRYNNPIPQASRLLGRSDWVLVLKASSSAQMTWAGASSNRIEVYTGAPSSSKEGAALNAQIYDPSGYPVGSELTVHESPAGIYPRNASVARDGLGNFIIAWEERSGPDLPGHIYARRLTSVGSSLGAAFEVSAAAGVDQFQPGVGADGAGRFLITWTERNLTTTKSSISGQAFDVNAFAAGDPIEISSQRGYEVDSSRTGCSIAGDCVVAWEQVNEGSRVAAIRAQRIGVAGTFVGSSYQVKQSAPGDLWLLYLGVAGDGASEARWEAIGTDGESAGSFNKLYDALGSVVQGEQAWTDPVTE